MDVPIDVSQVEIRTARLVLRPWRPEDLADLYAYASVEGVGEMAGWRHHESPADSEAILKIFISEKNVFALADRETRPGPRRIRLTGGFGPRRSAMCWPRTAGGGD